MEKAAKYLNGFVAGVCLEYAYRVESPVWYIPFTISILLITLMIADCTRK